MNIFYILGHLSHLGNLLQLVFVHRRAVCVVRRALKINILHFYLLLEYLKANCYHSWCEESLW